MQLPQGARHGDAGVDPGQGVSAVPAGKPAALPTLRLAQCGGAVSAAEQQCRRAVAGARLASRQPARVGAQAGHGDRDVTLDTRHWL